MCTDSKGGPGTHKERFVHDGYIPNKVLYLQEVDKNDSIWHQVLIDEVEGFKMDIYITMSMGSAGLGQGKSISGGKNDGHVWPIDPDRPDITGTGTGDAKRVQWRMLIEDADFRMDMLKDTWTKKPKITQNVSGSGGISMQTVIDMSNSTYSDMNTTGVVTHTQNIPGTLPFSFDSRTSPNAYVTAGRFKISHYSDDPVDPNYVYLDAPVNYGKNLNWLDYWHGSNNPAYWQPGEPYGYPNGDSGDSGKDEDLKW